MKKSVFKIVVVLLLVAFAVSGFMVVNYIIESKQQSNLHNDLANMVTTQPTEAQPQETTPADTTDSTVAAEPSETTEPTINPQYAEVYEKNNDTVGWLKIEGTKLNNPVMQTPNDPNFYLKRDFNKAASDWGTVYAWGSADLNRPSDNVTLFGHTMKDGSMFSVLHNYTQKYYWEENQLIFFDTLTECHMYKIYAVFKVSANVGSFAYHQFVDAANEEEFNDFVSTCKALSFYDTGITPVYGDKLLTLSTCEYTLDNGRLVVCAVRIT
ncbi:MAG: class B sortase [Oscillospiraceae bacterium]|nr:class B sortase [Oscillospiraceae bacterium]